MSTFQELIGTGQLELIRLRAVRRALASYERVINELDDAWDDFSVNLRRWALARIPTSVGDRFGTECAMSGEDGIYGYQAACEFDLRGWSAESLRKDLRAEEAQQLMRLSEHEYPAIQFFGSILKEEARPLERALIQEIAGR